MRADCPLCRNADPRTFEIARSRGLPIGAEPTHLDAVPTWHDGPSPYLWALPLRELGAGGWAGKGPVIVRAGGRWCRTTLVGVDPAQGEALVGEAVETLDPGGHRVHTVPVRVPLDSVAVDLEHSSWRARASVVLAARACQLRDEEPMFMGAPIAWERLALGVWKVTGTPGPMLVATRPGWEPRPDFLVEDCASTASLGELVWRTWQVAFPPAPEAA